MQERKWLSIYYFVDFPDSYMRYKNYFSELQSTQVLPGPNKFLAILVNNDLCKADSQVQGFTFHWL